MTEYALAKTGEYWTVTPQFRKDPASCVKHLRDNKHNSHPFGMKIHVHVHVHVRLDTFPFKEHFSVPQSSEFS